MRKSLGSLLGIILVIGIGFTLYTRMVGAREWGSADGGWAYSAGRICRNGVSFGLAFRDTFPITIERTLDAPVNTTRLTLSNGPINLDPDPADQPNGNFKTSGFFSIPWTDPLDPSTAVDLTFVTVESLESGKPLTWTTGLANVADCYLPDLSMNITGSPNPVIPGGTLNYTLNVTSSQGLVDETAVNSFPTTDDFFMTIPASGTGPGNAAPHPSEIYVAGLTGSVTAITVTLTGLSHTFPDDLDILLRGPRGQGVMLMSDAGGSFGISFVDLVFDDAAPTTLPDDGQITSGTYQPFDHPNTGIVPAPEIRHGGARPDALLLAGFNGTDPNGAWKLLVSDDQENNSGELIDWKLTITTRTRAATVVDTLPGATTFTSASGTGWICAHRSGVVTCTRGSLAAGTVPPITIAVQAPASTGTISNTATLVGSLPDPNTANNTSTEHTEVNLAGPSGSHVYLPFIRR